MNPRTSAVPGLAALLTLVACVSAAAGPPPKPGSQPGALPPPFVTGLNNPRGLTFGPDGALYVAEGGTGGDTGRPARVGDRALLWTKRLADAALLSGPKRYLMYGRLDAALARDAAPWVAYANRPRVVSLSARLGCRVYQPVYGMDLAALCVRHQS